MATTSQILANRENAKSSTGPTSTAGKAVSSQNHKVHGFCAVDPVLPTENREEFNALVAGYKAEYQANTPHLEFLATEMAGARWKLIRMGRVETEMLAALPDLGKAFTDPETAKAFGRLERYRAALERTYHRCAKELRDTIKLRNEPKSTQMAETNVDKLFQKILDASPEDLHFEPRHVTVDQG